MFILKWDISHVAIIDEQAPLFSNFAYSLYFNQYNIQLSNHNELHPAIHVTTAWKKTV